MSPDISTVRPTPHTVEIGGPDDAMSGFPSGLSALARRHGPLRFYTQGINAGQWIERYLTFSTGRWGGQPFRLLPWQWRLLIELLRCDEDGVLLHSQALIGVPKKNGKSEIAAALGLWFSLGYRERYPYVVVGATKMEQASLVYGAARRMCRHSKIFSDRDFARLGAEQLVFQIGDHGEEAILQKVASVGGSNDGGNVSAAIIDEIHELKTPAQRDMWVVLTQGGGARECSISIGITTAGELDETICYDLYCRHQERLDAPELGSEYSVWYEPPPEADWQDPETWRIANPSFGLVQNEQFYRDMIQKRTKAQFERYFLNRWVEIEDTWPGAKLWAPMFGKPAHKPEERLYVGIDFARRTDSAAVVGVQRRGVDYHVLQKIWGNPFPLGSPQHSEWELDIGLVESYLLDLFERFPEPAFVDENQRPMAGPCFSYDPAMFARSAEALVAEGLNCLVFPQNAMHMEPASSNLLAEFVNGTIVHDGSKVMARHIAACRMKESMRGWRLDKLKARKAANDGAIALAIAVFRERQGREAMMSAHSPDFGLRTFGG